jgi:hypothetical protein
MFERKTNEIHANGQSSWRTQDFPNTIKEPLPFNTDIDVSLIETTSELEFSLVTVSQYVWLMLALQQLVTNTHWKLIAVMYALLST